MSVKNTRATMVIVYGCPKAMKWAALEKQFATVRITDLPLTFGKHSTKSIVMSAHTVDGMAKG
jgi:hypothetical protein